jgi:hypothetical protein
MCSVEQIAPPHRVLRLPPDEWESWKNGISQRQETMVTELEPEEIVILRGRAQQQYNLTLLSGDLYLTDQRLIWESDIVDGLILISVVPLAAVEATRSGWHKLWQCLATVRRGLALLAYPGAKYFVTLRCRPQGTRPPEAAGLAA